jgi:hypothetical protein
MYAGSPAPRRRMQGTDTPLMSFFRPSDDIIFTSGPSPESERQPPAPFLRTSADCTDDDLPALLRAGATHGIQERTGAMNAEDEGDERSATRASSELETKEHNARQHQALQRERRSFRKLLCSSYKCPAPVGKKLSGIEDGDHSPQVQTARSRHRREEDAPKSPQRKLRPSRPRAPQIQ